MRTIAVFDDCNYATTKSLYKRSAVRAVIIANGKIALVKSTKEGYYKFPGGGIEENENHLQTLIRETREETGLTVIPESVREIGLIREIRKSIYNDDERFDQTSYYYYASVGDEIAAQSLDGYEAELGFALEWVDVKTAYDVDKAIGSQCRTCFILREATMLKLLLDDVFLIEPTTDYADAIADYRREFLDNGDSMDGTSSLRKYENPHEWLDWVSFAKTEAIRAEGWVPDTQYLCVRRCDNRIVGMLDIRSELNDECLSFYGNIGYSVRASERRMGYAKRQLALALDICKQNGMAKVLITCDVKNTASAKTIIANGGVLENEVFDPGDGAMTGRYWVKLK